MGAYVYVILVDGVLRYVGKGRRGRMHDHIRVARSIGKGKTYKPSTVHRNLAKAIDDGSSIVLRKILVGLGDDEAYALEKRAIEIAGLENLWNEIPGGNTGITSDFMKSVWVRPGYREKMSSITSERWGDPDSRELMLKRQREAITPAHIEAERDRAKKRWADGEYRLKQHATRSDHIYKAKTSVAVTASITDARRAAFGASVSASWKDPEKRASRVEQRRKTLAEKFGSTMQNEILQMVRLSPDGVSSKDLYSAFPGSNGTVGKLTKKNLIEKRGGKHGRFIATERI